ncbi:hypothetical protein K458DRAFT_79717 [Lentithecium fluviatile CBS 122367]|uniref:Uncharacterized protein n=1 Tax=Lentithecium fluviatile CBS 122367 TaxID=1168545 RepID=A0A6G1IU65_9PLEO|nr:hypothetical protein K458DRAFT_79717 [Lentithecium fluviatile CBS 122367]
MQSIYAFIPVAGAAPLGYPSDQRPALSTRLPHPVCDFDGNADFYGLGIRVGIYLQWISSLLANRYVPEAIRNLLITNTIFLLAVAIAAAQSTAAGTLRKAESLAVQHLCFGFLFTILSIWGFRIRTKVKVSGAVFSLAEKSFRLGLSAAICGYGVWYWFVGNYKLSRESCSTATFVFGKVDSLGAIRYFYQIQSVILLLVYGILFTRLCLSWAWIATKSLMKSVMLAAALATVDRIWGRSGHLIVNFVRRWIQTFSLRFWLAINGRMVSPEFSVPTAMHEFPLLNGMIVICWMIFQYCSLLILGKIMWPKEPPLLRLNSQTFNKIPSPFKKFPTHLVWANFFASLNSICLLWGIAATECTIYWNHIYNVYSVSSTGQLIPLIIGIANFIQIVYTIILQKSQPITSDIVLVSHTLRYWTR